MSPPSITLLPLQDPHQSNKDNLPTVHLIHNLLTPIECTSLITTHSPSLTPHAVSLTHRTRTIFEDASLAELLWERIATFFSSASPSLLHNEITDPDTQTWRATHINPRFRYCRYLPGGGFAPHIDGRRLAGVDCQSFMTVNIYLNDVVLADSSTGESGEVGAGAGGCTRILRRCEPCIRAQRADTEEYEEQPQHEHIVLGAVAPMTGLAAVFRDDVFHDGEVLQSGVKYLLRTDVMFERVEPFDLDRMLPGVSDEEKGRKALDMAVRLEDGNNFAEAVRWYKKAYRLDPRLERGED